MIRIGLAGCGRISYKHFEAICALPEFALTAVCDIDRKKADETSAKYKVPAFYDFDDFIANAKIDMVDICTPSGLHTGMGLKAAAKGLQIVLEKPMGLDLKEAVDLVELCEKKKLRLFVVKQNRFNSPVRKLKAAIDEGRFGRIYMGNTTVRWRRTQEYYDQAAWRGTWKFDGGVLMNQASHHVDLLQWLIGDVKSVFAKVRTYGHKIETDDTALVLAEFKNGAIGSVEATTCTSPVDLEGSVTVMGDKGTVKIGGFSVNKIEIWKFQDNKPNEEEEVRQLNQNPPNIYGFGHTLYFRNVLDTLLRDAKPMTDGREGLRTLKLLLAIYNSAASSKQVDLDGFRPA
jgi:predicted dehydrogenase